MEILIILLWIILINPLTWISVGIALGLAYLFKRFIK